MIDIMITIIIVCYPVCALSWLRMSCKQTLVTLLVFLMSCILLSVYTGFSTGIRLFFTGTMVEIIVIILLYYLGLKKEGIKFSEPLFDKEDTLKKLFEIIKSVYPPKK